MPEEIQTTVKVPLSEIVASLRRKHELPSKLTGVRIEGNNIVLNFIGGGQEPPELLRNSEPTRRKELEENINITDEEPMENPEPMNEEPSENEEVRDEESKEDEEARERRRFWRK